MSTRAVINFAKREDGVSFSEKPETTLFTLYHHYDGYPKHLGVGISEYLKDVSVMPKTWSESAGTANGIDCLAAQLLCYLKLGRHYGDNEMQNGNVYLSSPNAIHDTDYTYYVWSDFGKDIWISIFNSSNECIFVGKPDKLINKYK